MLITFSDGPRTYGYASGNQRILYASRAKWGTATGTDAPALYRNVIAALLAHGICYPNPRYDPAQLDADGVPLGQAQVALICASEVLYASTPTCLENGTPVPIKFKVGPNDLNKELKAIMFPRLELKGAEEGAPPAKKPRLLGVGAYCCAPPVQVEVVVGALPAPPMPAASGLPLANADAAGS